MGAKASASPHPGAELRQRRSTDRASIRAPDDRRSWPRPGTHLQLLGEFSLTHQGAPVHVPSNARRAVAFVALQERAVARGQVAVALWQDASEERASSNVRGIVWSLRKLGIPVLDGRDGVLRLSSGVALDTRDLAHASADVLQSRRVDPLIDLATFAEDLLPDWLDEWVAPARERLRQMRLHALEWVCTSLTEQGHLHSAVQAGLLAVAAEPLRESARRVLMQAYLAEGNRAEALRQYREFSYLLLTELRLQPTTDLSDLVDDASRGFVVAADIGKQARRG